MSDQRITRRQSLRFLLATVAATAAGAVLACTPTAQPSPAPATPAPTAAPAAPTTAPAARATIAPAKPTDFPGGKPITIMVPYAAGGTTDASARLLAEGLEKELSTSVQVVNKPGAASQVGLTELVNARPDGYTLSYGVLPTILTHYLIPGRNAPYTRQSFQPVAHHHLVPQMIAVLTESPYTTLRDLVEAARDKPEQIKISDSGLLATPHMSVLTLEKVAGVKFASVHFDGGAPSVSALLGGHVDAVAGGISDALPNFKAGKFRVLGVADKQESEFLPGVPTMTSQGYNVVVTSSTGVLAPAGTPREVVDVLTSAMKKVVETDAHEKRLNDLGLSPRYLNPGQYAAFWEDYEAQMAPVLKEVAPQ